MAVIIDRAILLGKLFPNGIPKHDAWNYSIPARTVYQAIMDTPATPANGSPWNGSSLRLQSSMDTSVKSVALDSSHHRPIAQTAAGQCVAFGTLYQPDSELHFGAASVILITDSGEEGLSMSPVIYTVPQLQETLSPVLARNGVKKAVLFGSYSKGSATEKSDVDLLVDSGLKGLRFIGFLNEVQEALGKNVDLFDVSHIEPGSLIDQEIQRTGVTVYEK